MTDLEWWPTIDDRAIDTLARVLDPGEVFVEPCAGDGELVRALESRSFHCLDAFDLEPRAPGIRRADARKESCFGSIATNPPFRWELLHPMLLHWRAERAHAWLLLPWKKTCNAYWGPFASHTHRMVPVRRVKWFEGTKHSSTMDFGWIEIDFARESSFLADRAA
jgi:hypothetical protein